MKHGACGTPDPRDQAIIEAYVAFDVPADRIVADPHVGAQFLDLVNGGIPTSHHLTHPACMTRLLNLRRLGEGKGGLPRLRRAYRGRRNSEN